jgi:hypothetical protein
MKKEKSGMKNKLKSLLENFVPALVFLSGFRAPASGF